MSVFDNLPINDLIMTAAISPRFTDIILNHYIIGKFRLHEKQQITLNGRNPFELMHFDKNGKNVILTNGSNATVFGLKIVGHILKHLNVEVTDFGSPDWLPIFESVDKYCSRATKEINIYGLNFQALAYWTYKFQHMPTTTIAIHQKIYNESIYLLFPLVENLSLLKLTVPLVQHLPHLAKCSIKFADDYKYPNICEFIRLNPQLRSFHTSMVNNNVSHVRFISEMLPNLESLSLTMQIKRLATDRETIHFKNVKEFSLRIYITIPLDSYRDAIGHIQFGQLETLKIKTLLPILAGDIIAMFSQNKNLNKIELDMRMTSEELLSVVETWPNLTEISLNLYYIDVFVALRAVSWDNLGLNKIHVFDRGNNIGADVLANVTQPGWQFIFNEFPLNSYSFVRLN